MHLDHPRPDEGPALGSIGEIQQCMPEGQLRLALGRKDDHRSIRVKSSCPARLVR